MIEIDYPNEGKIYCPACGKLVIDLGEAAIIEPCPHVEFLGTDEGPEFDRNKLWAQWEEWQEKAEKEDPNYWKTSEITHFMEYFRKTLDDHYVCFTQRTPAPGMLSGYTIFKFPLD